MGKQGHSHILLVWVWGWAGADTMGGGSCLVCFCSAHWHLTARKSCMHAVGHERRPLCSILLGTCTGERTPRSFIQR
jgi:hypothetical protein